VAVIDELMGLSWPEEFDVEYVDGSRERLLRGDGVTFTLPDDDPESVGGISANLPKKHSQNQKQLGRYVRLTELRAILTKDGHQLWPVV